MPTNIKVDRLLLIKALEDEQKKQTEQFKRDMERFRSDEKNYPEKLAAALEKAAKDIRRGKLPSKFNETRRNGNWVNVPELENWPERPQKPNKNGTVCGLQRQIRTLKLSKQDTITVNENSEYVKFICEL